MTSWKKFFNLILISLFVLTLPSLALSAETPENFSFWPIEGKIITPFQLPTNPYGSGGHRGIDIEAPLGAEVVAVGDGVVAFWSSNQGGNGMVISIDYPNGLTSTYLHLSEILPEAKRKGNQVKAGQTIGKVGNSGSPSPPIPHLHFGVFRTETRAESIYEYINPELVLPPITVSSESSSESPAPSPSEAVSPLPAPPEQGGMVPPLNTAGRAGSPNTPIEARSGTMPYSGIENSEPAPSTTAPNLETIPVATTDQSRGRSPNAPINAHGGVEISEPIAQPNLGLNAEPSPPKIVPQPAQPISQESEVSSQAISEAEGRAGSPNTPKAPVGVSYSPESAETLVRPRHSHSNGTSLRPPSLSGEAILVASRRRSNLSWRDQNYEKATKDGRDSYIQQDRVLPESKRRRLLQLIWIAFFGAITAFLVRSSGLSSNRLFNYQLLRSRLI